MQSSFYSLIGASREASAFASLFGSAEEASAFKAKTFKEKEKEITYYSSENDGISYCFENNLLTAIYLYSKFDKKFKPYSGELPYKLDFAMTAGDLVAKFGEPSKKLGGAGKSEISIEYESLGLEVNFLSRVWDKSSPISFIALFLPVEKGKMCGVCQKKENLLLCGRCKTIYYCGSQCQKSHWTSHKAFCVL